MFSIASIVLRDKIPSLTISCGESVRSCASDFVEGVKTGRKSCSILFHAVGQFEIAEVALPFLVVRPQRRVGDARHVAANDSFDRERFALFPDRYVRVRNGKHMIRHDIFRLLEPERAYLVQDLPLMRHMRDEAVKRRVPVGRDQNKSVVLLVIRPALCRCISCRARASLFRAKVLSYNIEGKLFTRRFRPFTRNNHFWLADNSPAICAAMPYFFASASILSGSGVRGAIPCPMFHARYASWSEISPFFAHTERSHPARIHY